MSADEGLHEEHEEHVNHEAWVIPYADLLTLLMAMFIALFAMSTVDMTKFKSLAIGFNEAFGGGKLETGVFSPTGGDGPMDGRGSGPGVQPGGAVGPDRQPESQLVLEALVQQYQNLQVAKVEERASLEGVQERIEERAVQLGLTGNLSSRLEERGLVVTVVTDQVLFSPGSADIQPDGALILRLVGEALRSVDNPILIEGHTDSTPISTERYPSNWELSGGRAASVARYFEDMELDREHLRSQGLADLYPIADNATREGRAKNRRVEIVIQSKLIDQTLELAGLSHDPVDSQPIDPVGDPVDNEIDPIVPGASP